MVVIPARVAHDVHNVGEDTLRVVGFFPSAAVVTTFEEVLAPMNLRVMVMGRRLPMPKKDPGPPPPSSKAPRPRTKEEVECASRMLTYAAGLLGPRAGIFERA